MNTIMSSIDLTRNHKFRQFHQCIQHAVDVQTECRNVHHKMLDHQKHLRGCESKPRGKVEMGDLDLDCITYCTGNTYYSYPGKICRNVVFTSDRLGISYCKPIVKTSYQRRFDLPAAGTIILIQLNLIPKKN